MAITIQRSVTFPPIRVRRIDEYVQYVAKNRPTIEALRESGVDIGRGRGDITRFLERIGVVEVDGGVVTLSKLGEKLVSLREFLGVSVYHALFYRRVPQYIHLVDSVREVGIVGVEDLHNIVNEKVAKTSPTAWVNKVAFKTLLQITEELGVVEKHDGSLRYGGDPVLSSVWSYYEKHGVRVGQLFYVPLDKVIVESCAKFEQPQSLYRVDVNCVVDKIYEFFST